MYEQFYTIGQLLGVDCVDPSLHLYDVLVAISVVLGQTIFKVFWEAGSAIQILFEHLKGVDIGQ